MNTDTKDYSRPTALATHSSRKYAKHRTALASVLWLALLTVCVSVLRAIPAAAARSILPAAVYLTMSVLPFALSALAPRTASFVAAVMLSAISTPVLVAGSGLAGGADILLLVALPPAIGYAAFGLVAGRLRGRRSVSLIVAASGLLLMPLIIYWQNTASSALIALPGAGPMGLTAMLLGRPAQWAPFGPSWISTGIYSAAGIISGPTGAGWKPAPKARATQR